MSYFYCEICSNMCECPEGLGNTLECCGQRMKKVDCNTNDQGSKEKHVPVYLVEGDKVCIKVGSEPHPANMEHHIIWVKLITNRGEHKRYLAPDDKPEVCFTLDRHEKVVKVLAYCNIHGLWSSAE